MPTVRKATPADLATWGTVRPVTEAQFAEALLVLRDILAEDRRERSQLRRELAALRAELAALKIEVEDRERLRVLSSRR